MSGDPRIERYASILVDECLDIQPGQQVLVMGTPLGRPLLEEVCRQLALKGAYALLRVTFNFSRFTPSWMLEASDELLAEPASLELDFLLKVDAMIAVVAPENTREMSQIPQQKLALLAKAYKPASERTLNGDLPWVGCQYPCPALAQDAGMSVGEFEEFLYGAVLLDWKAERERMQRYADRFDAAEEVRIVASGTDLRIGIAGRTMLVDAAGANIPGGEFFCSPVEDSAEGEITFSEFPAIRVGHEVNGVRLRFEGGKVVDASAASEEEYLLEVLDTDEGSRRIGELGIGCNPGITRYMKNTLFDEKMDGTVHIAIGAGFGFLGGKNESQIHWDIVKDLRDGGRIELDGEVVQQDGRWSV